MTDRVFALSSPAILGDVPAAHKLAHASLRFRLRGETQSVGAPFATNQNFDFE